MDESPARESRLRRLARRQGYALRKSRVRDPQVRDHGKWFVIEPDRNLLLSGEDGWTLDEVEEWLTSD